MNFKTSGQRTGGIYRYARGARKSEPREGPLPRCSERISAAGQTSSKAARVPQRRMMLNPLRRQPGTFRTIAAPADNPSVLFGILAATGMRDDMVNLRRVRQLRNLPVQRHRAQRALRLTFNHSATPANPNNHALPCHCARTRCRHTHLHGQVFNEREGQPSKASPLISTCFGHTCSKCLQLTPRPAQVGNQVRGLFLPCPGRLLQRMDTLT